MAAVAARLLDANTCTYAAMALPLRCGHRVANGDIQIANDSADECPVPQHVPSFAVINDVIFHAIAGRAHMVFRVKGSSICHRHSIRQCMVLNY
jgi:hypothetical protein